MSAQTSNEAQLLDLLVRTPVEDCARLLGEHEAARASIAGLIDYASRMALADASKSDAATDALVNLADRVGSQLDRARARRARARTLSYAGRFREALAVCDEGRRLANEAGDAIESARARLASMHALGELGQLDQAIVAGEAAREAFLAAGESTLAARADLNIGTAHQRSDDPATALRCFDRARASHANEPMVLGPLENNRGEALFALNDFAGAESAFTAAREIFRGQNATMAAAICESNLADVATRQGRLQQAMFHFEQARRSFEGGSSPTHLARMLAEQAEVMSMMGLVTESITEYERALVELDRHGLALEAARARTGLGTALLRLGRHAAGETALAAAATAFDELKHDTARARVDLRRAELAAGNGRVGDGRSIALRALATLHDRPVDAATARLTLARIAMVAGDRGTAESELKAALALADREGIAPLRAETLQQRAALNRDGGKLNEAIIDLSAAAEEIDRIRGTLQAERFRSAFHGDRADAYEELITALLDRAEPGDIDRAFETCERIKSRTLLEAVRNDVQAASDSNKPDQYDADADLWRRLDLARSQLNGLYSVLHDDRSRSQRVHDDWRERVARSEREVDELEARLATTERQSGASRAFVSTITAPEARKLVSGGQCLIEFFIVGDEILAFTIDDDGIAAHRHIGSRAALLPLLQRLQFQIGRALRPGALDSSRSERLIADADRVLSEIAATVLRTIEDHITACQELFVVPHGVLHGVPFHALPIDGRAIIETHRVSYAPSAGLLAAIREEATLIDLLRDPLVVGVADDVAPEIEHEAAMVAESLRCTEQGLLLGAAATAQSVAARACRCSLLHLACHGRYAPETPMGSGLRLADRWLTARDLMRIRLRAGLITLSGCETGLNRVQSGDELIGLMRGFFAAGAKTILGSLWRVDDPTTREFMQAFYGCLNTLDATSPSIADALRAAQIALKSAHPHPALWAPFVLAGRP